MQKDWKKLKKWSIETACKNSHVKGRINPVVKVDIEIERTQKNYKTKKTK